MHSRHFLDHCFHAVSGLNACLKKCSVYWALSHPNWLTFKTPKVRDLVWWGSVVVLWERVLLCWDWCTHLTHNGSHARVQAHGISCLSRCLHAYTKAERGQKVKWCLPPLLSPERQCHFSHMHSKKKEQSPLCLPPCTLGDPPITLSAPQGVCLPSFQE